MKEPKRMNIDSQKRPAPQLPKEVYSSRRVKRSEEIARYNYLFAEPTSFAQARDRGLNYWYDNEN